MKQRLKNFGFFRRMDLAPGEVVQPTRDVLYDRAKEPLLKLIEEDWGPRCKTKDTDDFPGEDLTESRCPVCVVYERLDQLWKGLHLYEDD